MLMFCCDLEKGGIRGMEMAYFQDLLNFKYSLTGEQVNVGNLLQKKKKKEKGASLSVNLQIKPFSITPPHLICSPSERVTFLLPARTETQEQEAAFRVVANLINTLFTICERVRSSSHCRAKGSPGVEISSSEISCKRESSQPLPLSLRTKHDLRNLKAIKWPRAGELSSDVRCGLCRRFCKSSSDYIDECLEGPARAQHLQPAEALILNPSKVPLIFLKDLYGF